MPGLYEIWNDTLGKRSSKLVKGKRATKLHRLSDGTIALRYHATDVVLATPGGRVILESGGWRTLTTKTRMNEALSQLPRDPEGSYRRFQVSSDRGVWYVSVPKGDSYESVVYKDGMSISPGGRIKGAAKPEAVKTQQAERNKIKKYATDFVKALQAGKVPAPSGGDCWMCSMTDGFGKSLGDGDKTHIKSHIKERYFVPSLLFVAVEASGVSQAAKWVINAHWHPEDKNSARVLESFGSRGFIYTQIRKGLTRYLYTQLGFPV